METPVNKQVKASYIKQLLELDSMIVDSTKAFNVQINDYLKTRIFLVKQWQKKFKVTLKCEACDREFQGEYGDDEGISEACCDAFILCPQCSKNHDCQCEEDELPL